MLFVLENFLIPSISKMYEFISFVLINEKKSHLGLRNIKNRELNCILKYHIFILIAKTSQVLK